MASLSKPQTEDRAEFLRIPTTGRIEFKPVTGEFVRMFPTKYNDAGEKVQDYSFETLRNPKFIVVAVGFMAISGGKMETDGTFTSCKIYGQPVVCYDKGLKWEQVIPVKIGSENRPRFSGKWSEIKERVKEVHKGKYTEVLFVVAADYPDELLTLELGGNELTALGDAKQAAGMKYTSGLVQQMHTLHCTETETYQNAMRATFHKPVFRIQKFDQASKGYETMYAKIIEMSILVDAYSDYLVTLQEGTDGQAADGHAVTHAEKTAQYEAAHPEATAKQAPVFEPIANLPDGLPF